MTSINEILAERGKNYGKFPEHAKISQALKTVLHSAPKWNELNATKKEALEMVMHKVARVLNGDSDYLDNYNDMIGYTQLMINEIEDKKSIKNGINAQTGKGLYL